MRLCKVKDLFEVRYGNGLELNAMEPDPDGIRFIARTSKDNGVTARVKRHPYIETCPSGTITVAASGSVMESFLQTEPYYTAYHVFVLTPKTNMTDTEKLYYCMCLRRNKFKYSYGRQANETLSDLLIPALEDVPDYAKDMSLNEAKAALIGSVNVNGFAEKAQNAGDSHELVPLSELFTFHNGLSADHVLRSKSKQSDNWVAFVRPSYRQATSIDAFVNKTLVPSDKVFPPETLYVSTNGQGSHTYSYVSATEFVPNSDVCVLLPKCDMCLREKLFYAMCITRNRFKFSYGRKPKGVKLSSILVPKQIPSVINNLTVEQLLL